MNIDIILSLPEELVEQAAAAGLLSDERIAWMLEAEIKRQSHIRSFQETVEQLRNLEPPFTQEEINEELQAYRTEKRNDNN